MRQPSIRTIVRGLDCTNQQAKKIKDIFSNSVDLENYDSVKSLIYQCYNPPGHVQKSMTAINEILEGYGVECIEEISTQYVNMGDTYINTVCYKNGRFYVNSWSDLMEANISV